MVKEVKNQLGDVLVKLVHFYLVLLRMRMMVKMIYQDFILLEKLVLVIHLRVMCLFLNDCFWNTAP